MPHSLIKTLFGSAYNHFQHELVRMYGALTLAQVRKGACAARHGGKKLLYCLFWNLPRSICQVIPSYPSCGPFCANSFTTPAYVLGTNYSNVRVEFLLLLLQTKGSHKSDCKRVPYIFFSQAPSEASWCLFWPSPGFSEEHRVGADPLG